MSLKILGISDWLKCSIELKKKKNPCPEQLDATEPRGLALLSWLITEFKTS